MDCYQRRGGPSGWLNQASMSRAEIAPGGGSAGCPAATSARVNQRASSSSPSRRVMASVRATAAKPAVSAPAVEASIAVLPFADLSGHGDYEYFGAGLAEEIINSLSRLNGIRVAARRSAFFFRDRDADIHEIADRLAVNLVLEGTVRKSGNRLRVTAQLINAAAGYQLWSERYDREIDMQDIFAVQDEITLAVVDALKLKLPLMRWVSWPTLCQVTL